MANSPLPYTPNSLNMSAEYLESLQVPKLRAGGASSSHILNRLFERTGKDLTRLQVDVEDAVDNTRTQALLLAAQNVGLARFCGSLQAQFFALPSQTQGLADFYLNTLTVSNPSVTTADINPLFGQVIFPATSRQNVLVIERGNGEPNVIPMATRILLALQPDVTTSTNAAPPADYLFGEDIYSVFSLDGDDRTYWPIEDPTATAHMAWIEIDLPGDISGAYKCNELEFVPCCLNLDLVAVQAEVIGQGWQDVDFSYLPGYDPANRAVHNVGPSRLCFAQTSIDRIRLGFWVAGFWGFYAFRVLFAQYNPTANVAVNFTALTSSPLQTIVPTGKNPTQLAALPVNLSGQQVTLTLQPTASLSETPVITGIQATW